MCVCVCVYMYMLYALWEWHLTEYVWARAGGGPGQVTFWPMWPSPQVEFCTPGLDELLSTWSYLFETSGPVVIES